MSNETSPGNPAGSEAFGNGVAPLRAGFFRLTGGRIGPFFVDRLRQSHPGCGCGDHADQEVPARDQGEEVLDGGQDA
jgi:hypothetical protein